MNDSHQTPLAETVLPCPDMEAALAFYVDRLGFKLMSIYPADDPRRAVLDGFGLRLCLDRDGRGAPGHLRLYGLNTGDLGGRESHLEAPNGTRIELLPFQQELRLPPPAPTLQVTTYHEAADWVEGRAGMRYRDLLPNRQGGRFIASHIQIPEGGPVPDYVHFHKVRFQVIYCYKGWVRVVYEDQGPPFVMRAGDCVLQPPRIRHRVLEASQGLEVIELGCPAEHETHVDHQLGLPTRRVVPDRCFAGQTFVFHQAARAAASPWRLPGFIARDTGIAAATKGLASVVVVRPTDFVAGGSSRHEGELMFFFVLEGGFDLILDGAVYPLKTGAACSLPKGVAYTLSGCSDDLQLLEVALPGQG